MIDREKVETYEMLVNMGCRTVLGIIVMIGWVVLLGFFIWRPSLYTGLLAGVLPFSARFVFGYYFAPPRERGRDKANDSK